MAVYSDGGDIDVANAIAANYGNNLPCININNVNEI